MLMRLKVPGKISEWMGQGFSQEEVEGFIVKKTPEWEGEGFSKGEIHEYLGSAPFDITGMDEVLLEAADRGNIKWREEEEVGVGFLKALAPGLTMGELSQDPSDEMGVLRAAKIGLQGSVGGLAYRGELPEFVPEEILANLPVQERLAMQIGTLAGDLPYLAAAWVAATGAGALIGPFAPVIGLGAGFGLVEGLRKVYWDKYQKGEIRSVKEFVFRLNDALWEMEKGFTVGAATGAAGAGSKWLFALAKEIPTLVGVSAALEMRLPEPQEFLDAAVLLGGLKGIHKTVNVLGKHWVKTGERPSEAMARIMRENEREGRLLPRLIRRDPELGLKAGEPRTVEEILGEPPKTIQKLKTFSGEPEPYDGPLTPEQRYWKNWKTSKSVDAKEMKIQDIKDEAVDKMVEEVREGEAPWSLREELDKIVKEEQGEKGEVGDPEGVGEVKVLGRKSRKPSSLGGKEGAIDLEVLKEAFEKGGEKLKEILKELPEELRKFAVDVKSYDRLRNLDDMELVEKNIAPPTSDVSKYYRPAVRLDDGTILWHPKARIHVDAVDLNLKKMKGKTYDNVEGTGGIGPDGHYYESEFFGDIPEVAEVLASATGKVLGEVKEIEDFALKVGAEYKGTQLVEDLHSFTDRVTGGDFSIKGKVTERGIATELQRVRDSGIKPLDPFSSDKGFLDLNVVAEAFSKIKDIGEWVKKEAPYLLKYPYFSGKEGLKELRNLQHQLVSLPWWRQQNDPTFKPYFQVEYKGNEAKSEMLYKILTKVDPVFRLRGKAAKEYRRIALASDKANYEYETLKDYTSKTKDTVSQKTFDVYKLVRKNLDEFRDMQLNELRREGADPEELQSLITEMGKIKGYFPRVREGKYFLEATKEGEPRVREHYDNEGQYGKRKKELEAEGYAVSEGEEIPLIPDEMYARGSVETINAILDVATENWEPAMRKQIFKEVSDVIKGRGFLARGIKRGEEFVVGFEEKNFKKILMQHFMGGTNIIVKAKKARQFREQFYNDYSEGKLSNAQKKEISKYVTDMMSPTTKAAQLSAKVRALLFAKYLGLSAKSATVNLTGSFIAAYPRLGMETQFPLAKLTAAMNDITVHAIGKGVKLGVDKLTKEEGPQATILEVEEIRSLRMSLQKGYTQDLYTQELMGSLRNLGSVGFLVSKILGGPMSITEKFNRLTTHLAAFRVFRNEKGLSFEEANEKSKALVLDAHGLYGHSNLPGAFRGGSIQDTLRTAYTFRAYPHNLLNLYAKFAREDRVAVLRTTASILALAGLSGIPFLKTIEGLLAREGITPRSDLKELMEENGVEDLWELVNYGLPGLAGIDLSGSIGMELPGQRTIGSEDVAGILGEAAVDIFGVPSGIVEDTFRAVKQLGYKDFGRALEEAPFTPQFLANYLGGTRMEREGLTTGEGKVIRGEEGEQVFLGEGEAFKKKFLGFQPSRVSEGWRTFQARKAETSRWEKEKSDLKVAFRKAAVDDFEGLGKIVEQINTLNTTKPPYIEPIDTSALWKEVSPVLAPASKELFLQEEIR